MRLPRLSHRHRRKVFQGQLSKIIIQYEHFPSVVLKDDVLDFSEGSAVRLKENGDEVFFGFVFKQQRAKEQIITVTAYDQLRYLKNKDTIVYENNPLLLLEDRLLFQVHSQSIIQRSFEHTPFLSCRDCQDLPRINQVRVSPYHAFVGVLENTNYIIESRVEENTSLFEMIQNALDLTLQNTGEMSS